MCIRFIPKISKLFFWAPGPYASQANTGAEQACNPYARGCLGFPFAPKKFQKKIYIINNNFLIIIMFK